VAFLLDGGGQTVAWENAGVVGQLHQFAAQRIHDLVQRAAPQIGAADAAGEERIAGEELRDGQRAVGYHHVSVVFGLGGRCREEIGGRKRFWRQVFRKIQAHAAGRMAWGMDDGRLEHAPVQRVTLFQELVDVGEFGSGDTEICGLDVHAVIEREIVAMHEDGSAGVLAELGEAADVVDVRMRADDGFYGELVAAEQVQDAGDFVAWVDDQGFAGDGVGDDGAVALQHANGNGDVEELRGGGVSGARGFAHRVRLPRLASGWFIGPFRLGDMV
jgi:hypothetical protein